MQSSGHTVLIAVLLILLFPCLVFVGVHVRNRLQAPTLGSSGSSSSSTNPCIVDEGARSKHFQEELFSKLQKDKRSASHSASLVQRVQELEQRLLEARVELAHQRKNSSTSRSKTKNARRERRFVLVSFIDSAGSNSVGIMFGATARLCYAKMHGYHAVMYGDAHLQGWVPPTKEVPHNDYKPGQIHRSWSKNFMVKRAMFEFNLTTDDWVFWNDGDTLITKPSITLEEIVEQASRRHLPNGTLVTTEPDMIIASSWDGINDGVYAIRATPWSLRFLEYWWQDQNSNQHAADNGPFMHSVLVHLAQGAGVTYNNECHMRTNDGYRTFGPFSNCMRGYLQSTLCRGNLLPCMQRVPHSDRPLDSAWKEGFHHGTDWEWGYALEYSPHIAAHPRINDGLGWKPCADWSEKESWIMHMAGTNGDVRNRVITEFASKYGESFNPRCF